MESRVLKRLGDYVGDLGVAGHREQPRSTPRDEMDWRLLK